MGMVMTNAERQAHWRERRDQRQNEHVAKLRRRIAELEGGPLHSGAEPESEARERRALTSGEQDQILNVVIQLLKSVDASHEKKFHKYYVANTYQGVLAPTCSHVGWKGGRFRLDDHLLARLWAAIATSAGCRWAPGERDTARGAASASKSAC
jgi:hypothetical protein